MVDPNEKIRLVELTEYNPEWPQSFTDAANEIKSILKENLVQIHHIGSTAIPGIYAKPIVDVLPVVKDITSIDALNPEFEKLGYVCMGEYGIPGRRYYWKFKSKRTHHIHLFEQDSPEIRRHSFICLLVSFHSKITLKLLYLQSKLEQLLKFYMRFLTAWKILYQDM